MVWEYPPSKKQHRGQWKGNRDFELTEKRAENTISRSEYMRILTRIIAKFAHIRVLIRTASLLLSLYFYLYYCEKNSNTY